MPKRLLHKGTRDPLVEQLADVLDEHRRNEKGPWWSDRLDQWGPTLFMMLALLAVLMGWLPSPFKNLEQIPELQRTLESHQKSGEQIGEKATQTADQQTRLMRNMCRTMARLAKNPAAEEACDR